MKSRLEQILECQIRVQPHSVDHVQNIDASHMANIDVNNMLFLLNIIGLEPSTLSIEA